jgi:hypothetical protein
MVRGISNYLCLALTFNSSHLQYSEYQILNAKHLKDCDSVRLRKQNTTEC